jgi:hypothetical protein
MSKPSSTMRSIIKAMHGKAPGVRSAWFGYRLLLIIAVAIIGLLAAGASLASSQSRGTRPVPEWLHALQAHQRYATALRPPPSHAGPKAARKELARLQQAARAAQPSQPPLPAGIVRSSHAFGPFSHCTFAAYSSYISPPTGAGRVQTILYAGVVHPPGCGFGTHGGVYEYRSAGNRMSAVGMSAVSAGSPLDIITVHGQTVTLRSAAGQRYTFDLATRSFRQ